MAKKILRIGIPKGSLQDATIELFNRASFRMKVDDRSYVPEIEGLPLEITMFRAQEMAGYISDNTIDVGITGLDWTFDWLIKAKWDYVVREIGSSVSANKKRKEIHKVFLDVLLKAVKDSTDIRFVGDDLIYSKSSRDKLRWVIAVKEDSNIKEIGDLDGKRVATELKNVAKLYFKTLNVSPEIEFSWGGTEAKVAKELVDAVVEATETGSTLRANKLKELETVLVSSPRMIANKAALENKWKKEKIGEIYMLLKSVLDAEKMVGLKMNIKEDDYMKVKDKLPAMKKPTVSELRGAKGWIAIEIMVDEDKARELIPRLKRDGACGIIEYKINKVID